MFHMMKDQRKNIGGNSNQKIEIKALRKKRDAFFSSLSRNYLIRCNNTSDYP